MKTPAESLTYDQAFQELQNLLREIQEETASVDDLSARLARATELIRFCQERLRMTEEEIARLNQAL